MEPYESPIRLLFDLWNAMVNRQPPTSEQLDRVRRVADQHNASGQPTVIVRSDDRFFIEEA